MNKRAWLNTLWLRLALGLLAITLLVIGVVALVVGASVETSFNQYVAVSNTTRFGVDLVGALEAYYAEHGSWAGVDALLPARGRSEGSGSEARGLQVFLADQIGVIVAASQPDWVGRRIDDIGPSRLVKLYRADDSALIGTLGEQTPGTLALIEAEAQFARNITTGLGVTAVLGGLTVFGLGIGLSYSLTRPLQRLTNHMEGWQPRRVQPPLSVGGSDEVRRLSAAFNAMIARLAAGEAQRQRLTADVAHELRTPVTVIRGHLEAMMDGVYPLDTAHLGVAYDQALHLARLVEDLRLLTLAEADQLPLNRAALPLEPVIRHALERFEPLAQDQNIGMTALLLANMPSVQADAHRLQQVFDNLLSNALRYTPPEGRIEIAVTQVGQAVQVSIYNDSAPPLDDAQIAHLFDRFWRSAEARERDSGGSGLGLAITRELLRLMGGTIQAARADLGLRFTFTLPLA